MQRPPTNEQIETAPGLGQTQTSVSSTGGAQTGQILSGKYRLIHVLGEGSMGTVWLAEHLALRASVALKLMRGNRHEADACARFLREARIASLLRSPHVVQVLDYGVDAGMAYIVMERLEGESLAARLERLGALDSTQTIRIITQVARALRRVHECGIVHRDLKPQNIFIVDDDDEEITKLIDFGIVTDAASAGAPARKSMTMDFIGTPQYMSPEQAACTASVDRRADIWALGVIVFECLLGYPPFTGNNLGRILLAMQSDPLPTPSASGRVPKTFDAWFQRACARDRTQRFASAQTAAEGLASALGAAPRPCRRLGRRVWLVALAAFVLAASLALRAGTRKIDTPNRVATSASM